MNRETSPRNMLAVKVLQDAHKAEECFAKLIDAARVKGYVAIDVERRYLHTLDGLLSIQFAIDEAFPDMGTHETALPAKRIATVLVVNTKVHTLPHSVREILTDPTIVKLGCHFDDTERWLSDRYDITCGSVVDIQHVATTCGFTRPSLNIISKTLCGLSKLDPDEDLHGAYNAYLTLECYLRLVTYRHPLLSQARMPTTKDSALGFFEWALTTDMQKGLPVSRRTLYRATVGYAPWACAYARKDLSDVLDNALELLEPLGYITRLEGDYIRFDRLRYNLKVSDEPPPYGEFPPLLPQRKTSSTPAITRQVALTSSPPGIAHRQEMHAALARCNIVIPPRGIKRESYVSCLANTNWLKSPPDERRLRAMRVIDDALTEGILILRDDMLHRTQ